MLYPNLRGGGQKVSDPNFSPNWNPPNFGFPNEQSYDVIKMGNSLESVYDLVA